MGTLFDQPVRDHHEIKESVILDNIDMIKRIKEKTNLSIDQIIHLLDIMSRERSNDLYKANGDIFDEQMSGIGHLLQEIEGNIGDIAKALSNED